MKIILLVVENRPYIFTVHTKWIVKTILNKEVDDVLFWNEDKKPIWFMRRKLIQKALKTDCSHILFVDTDVIPPKNFIQKLKGHNKDIVSGIYHLFTSISCSQKDGKFYQGKGLEQVDVCSIGASLIKRKVLEKVKYPKPDKPSMDADYEFCREVKKHFKIYQDFDLNCFHIQIVPIIKK